MKIQIKPLISLGSGMMLLAGMLCQPAQAAIEMIETNTAVLADALGSNTPPEALTVGYSVTKDTLSDVYTYTYTVNNPSGDVILPPAINAGQSEIVDLFAVDFYESSSTLIAGSIAGGRPFGLPVAGFGVEWLLSTPNVVAGTSATLSFQSYDAPVMGNASAADANPPSPWDSYPDGSQVPVPAPDSTNTMTLLAGMMLLLPFRSAIRSRAKAS